MFKAQEPKSALATRQGTNAWAAMIIPPFIAGVVGYATWVIVVLISIHYLMFPDPTLNVKPRPGAAAAILTVYFILFILMTSCYIRAWLIAITGSSSLPQGPILPSLRDHFISDPPKTYQLPCAPAPSAPDPEKQPQTTGPGYTSYTLDLDGIFNGDVALPPGSEAFYSHRIFQCDPSGLPIWCPTCRNWKPDRAHHCSDNGRCARKLDHYCPWVGGVVAEPNFKFFVQFVFYGALYTFFTALICVIYTAEAHPNANPAWEVAIGLSILFCLFSIGMFAKSGQDAARNLTTVDNLGADKRTVHLAVRLPPGQTAPEPHDDPIPWQGTIVYPFYTRDVPDSQRGPRTRFAVIRTPPGANPWDLGGIGNWKSVMGERIIDRLLPIRASPCSVHNTGGESDYALGEQMRDILLRAGIRS